MEYVYMLHCSDDSYYIGWTNDIEKRVAAHNAQKGAKYTRTRLPAKLVYLESYEDRSTAKKREIQLKKLNHRERERLAEAFTEKNL